jgi:hypothetical protein
MAVDICIRDYNPPRCFQKKISGRSKHNGQSVKGAVPFGINFPQLIFQSFVVAGLLKMALENT